jgi:hypothetical protein
VNCNLVIPLSPNWWIVHEKKNTDIAVRVVQVNSAMFANLDAFKRSVQNARDNVKEFSRIGVNNSKTFEEVSREITPTTSSSL